MERRRQCSSVVEYRRPNAIMVSVSWHRGTSSSMFDNLFLEGAQIFPCLSQEILQFGIIVLQCFVIGDECF